MTARDLLLRDKELVKWLLGFTKDVRFEQVQMILRAHFSQTAGNWDKLVGANEAITLFSTITDNDYSNVPMPSSGLDHRTPEEIIRDSRLTRTKPKTL